MNSSKYEKDIFECHGALYSNKGIYRVSNIVLAICYSLESVAGVVLNVVVLLAMKRNKKLHVLSNYFVDGIVNRGSAGRIGDRSLFGHTFVSSSKKQTRVCFVKCYNIIRLFYSNSFIFHYNRSNHGAVSGSCLSIFSRTENNST